MHKILLIEDDVFIHDLYGGVLRQNDYEVDVAADGESGHQKIVEGGYDLILLDIMLPKLDGLQILEKLQKDNTPHPPIILLTNLAQETIIQQAYSMGAVGYLLKVKVLPKQLVNTVHTFFETGSFTSSQVGVFGAS